MKYIVVVENKAQLPFVAEHGLALLIEHNSKKILFDTGASYALVQNATTMGIDLSTIDTIILSHGHNDHTGGLKHLSDNCTIYASPDISKERFSIHQSKPISNISMPEEAKEKLLNSNWIKNETLSEIFDGVYLSGQIPRISDEDTGGPFFLDTTKSSPDFIIDEQALLFAEGVLFQGCCHSGIINTLTHLKTNCPSIKIHTIVGGLHLVHASEKRLEQTANCLNDFGIKKLHLLHCTGENAIEYLSYKCKNIEIITPQTGDVISCNLK
ncbi:MAG: MBL fold metallo-hydrolase [Verrucomicrobiaceae bacterium]|nr:MBL fold metallo-hydrolase [Verrucomicrobiaceae bacterium]